MTGVLRRMHDLTDGAHDRAALDDQYDTAKRLPDNDVMPYFERFDEASRRARDEWPVERDLRYGSHERETFDFFPGSRPGAPLFVWLHGGYWRRLSKDANSFVAAPVLRAGGAVALLNYPLAPGPSLDSIVNSVLRGYAAAREYASHAGVDPARSFVGGHSVGAQLAAAIAATHSVGGLFALSGLYDLEPLRHTHINDWIAMDAATAARNSPICLRPLARATLVASVGGCESSEFHRQQRAYVEAWRGWALCAREIASPTHDHFSILLELARTGSALEAALLDMLALR